MAKIVKTLNLLNEDYQFDAAKLGGQLPQSFVSTSGATMQGELVFDGTNKIEAMGAMFVESSDSVDIDAGTYVSLSTTNTQLKVDNSGVYINDQRVVPGGGSSSGGGLSYVGTGISYNGTLFDFEDLDFNTNALNGHHVLIDWYLEDKGSHIGTSTTYFSNGAYGSATVFLATTLQMLGVCILAGNMLTGPGPYFDGGFMIIDNEDLQNKIMDYGLRGDFYLMD